MPTNKRMLLILLAGWLVAVLGVLGLATCKPHDSSEEGQWVRLPGGRMVYGTPGKPENVERLIYKIDDQRYFTMMVSEDHPNCGSGTAWYHDKTRGIHSEVGRTEVNELRIFAIDPGKNLAIPVPSGDLQNNSKLIFSADFGRTWQSIRFVEPGAGMVVKGDVLVFLEGSASFNNSIEINGAQVWPFSSLLTAVQQPEANTPTADHYGYWPEDDLGGGGDERVWKLRSGIQKEDVASVEIDDISSYPKIVPPSGWKHMRCDPISVNRTER